MGNIEISKKEADSAVEVVKEFSMTLRQQKLYSLDHRVVSDHLSKCFHFLNHLLDQRGSLSINIVDGKLLINGEGPDDKGPAIEMLVRFMEGHDLESIIFSRGTTIEELMLFFRFFAEGSNVLKECVDREKSFEIKGLTHIKLNKIHYAKVDEGEFVKKGYGSSEDDQVNIGAFEAEPKIEMLIQKLVVEVSPDQQTQRKLYEIVMQRLQSEVEEKIFEATKDISDDKDMALFQKETAEAVFENMAGGVVVVDDDGKIITMNQTAQSLMEGKRVGTKLMDDLGEEHMVVLTREFSGENGNLKRDIGVSGDKETEETLRASTAIVQDKKGRPVGIVTSLNDITQQKELLRMKENFISSVSHELRTPLAIVKQNISMLLEGVIGDINEKQGRVLTLARKNVERLSRLVNDVLDLSTFRAGKMKLNPQESDLEDVVDEIIETYRGWADEKGIRLSSEHAGHYPMMLFDRDKMIQVITNLVSNSIKFTYEGGEVTVFTNLKTMKVNGAGTMGVFVKDSGPGIAKEDLDKVFDEFHRVGDARQGSAKGTGLGLPISKKIIELHKGKMHVDSEVGKGSIFSFTIPVQVIVEKQKEENERRAGFFARLFVRIGVTKGMRAEV